MALTKEEQAELLKTEVDLGNVFSDFTQPKVIAIILISIISITVVSIIIYYLIQYINENEESIKGKIKNDEM